MNIYWGIRKKLSAAMVLIMLPLLAGAVLISTRLAATSHSKQAIILETAKLGQVSSRLEFLSRMAVSDTAALARVPALISLARAGLNGGTAPLTGRNLEQNFTNLENMLLGFMESKQVYDQVRLLGPMGREIIRVDHGNKKARTIPRTRLQDKGQRYYFTEAAKLPAGKVYVSFVDLNREKGEIEKPFKPVLRFASPLRDARGRLMGVVILNFYAEYLFRDSFIGVLRNDSDIWMILDQDGYYLYHSQDPDRLWGAPRDLNTGRNCQKYLGRACRNIMNGKMGLVKKDGSVWESYSRIVTFPQNPDKRLIVVHLTPQPTFLAYLSQFGGLMILIMVFVLAVTLLLFWLSERLIAGPMVRLAGTLKRFGENDWTARSKVTSRDEVGSLAAGFNDMAERLQSFYTDLESKVNQRTAELEELNNRLKGSEAQARAILDSTVDAIITMDTGGIVLSFNKGAEKIFGYTAGEVVGQKINMLQPPGVAEKHDRYLHDYLETGQKNIIGKSRAEMGRRKDGRLFPLYLAVSEVRVNDSRFFTGIIRDITELRATEDSLKESRLKYKTLAEAAPAGIFNTDTRGKCTYVNGEWSRIAGLTEEQALVEGWSMAIHPEDRETVFEEWNRTAQLEIPFEAEYRFQRPDGKITWVFGRAVAQKDEDGRVTGYVGTITDINQRKEMEDELAETAQRLQATFEQAAVGIAQVGPDGTWLKVNNKICEIVGYSREEILSKTFQDVTHPDDLGPDQQMVNRVLAGELENFDIEKRYIRKDGSHIWVNLTVSLVRHEDGSPRYFISVVEDIDLRKQAEKAKARAEAALKAREQRFRTLVANVPGAVFRCKNDADWTMSFISKPIEAISGYSPDDFIDNKRISFAGIIYPDDRAGVAEEVARSLEKGEGLEVEYRIIRKDGQIRWIYGKGQAISDEEGNQWLDGALLDFTDRKLIEEDNLALGRILEDSTNEIFIFTMDSLQFVQVNRGGRQNLGYSMEEFREMTPLSIKPGMTPEKFEELIAPLKEGLKQRVEFKTIHRRKDGSTYPVEINLQKSIRELRPVFVAIIQDVSEKVEDQAAIERLSMVAERTDNAVMISDEQGRIQWVNTAFTKVTEYSPEEALGKNPGDLLQGEETDPETIRYMGQKLAQGEGFNVEVVNYTKTGNKYWLSLGVQPVHDETGRIINFVSVASDITQLKRTEQELRQQAQIIDQTLDAVVSIDLDGLVTSWNQGAEALFGYNKEETIGNHVAMVHPKQDVPNLDELVFLPLLRRGKYEVELPLIKKGDQMFTALLSLTVLSDSDELPVGFVGYILDISKRKEAEEAVRRAKEAAEAANRIKSEFMANMSHELRTPLNAIIGFSEILIDQTFGDLNQKQTRHTNYILESGRHLLSLINDILDLSKVESGKMELGLSVVNLASLLESSLVLIKEKTLKHGVSVDLEIPGAMPELNFPADERKLKQIMFNLLSNAAKFTPDGGRITVAASREGNEVKVSVSDTGVGIEPKDQERIFEEFEQIDSTYARQQQGTGLGLALTRKLVELHGGHIWVESEGLGQGSTFSFVIPIEPGKAIAHPAKTTPDSDPAAETSEAENRQTILVVDDDPLARELLTDYLEESGYAVITAGSGAQAMEQARTAHPEAITLDIVLPDISGFEVLRRLQQDEATADIPVIIVSITQDRKKGIQLGATEYLQKPVNKKDLLATLTDLAPCQASGLRKVLVVDDNPADLEMIRAIVATRGCRVITAQSGAKGMDLALRENYDLIILDLDMPEISGWDFLEKLRERKDREYPPILVFTGVSLSDEQRSKLAGEVNAVVLKGGGKEDLLNEIDRIVKNPSEREAKDNG